MIKRKYILTVCISALTASALTQYAAYGAVPAGNTPGRTYVIFRYDDYSNWTSTSLESRLIEVFAKYDAPCTFTIIPFSDTHDYTTPGRQNLAPLNSEKADILKRAIASGTIEPGQHGYAHLPAVKGAGSEFRGLSYDAQMQKISEGKASLEDILGVEISVFCPPWNSYDRTTLRALDALGFHCISAASRHGEVDESVGLAYVPATCEVLHMRTAIEKARTADAATRIIVVMFHEFNFVEADSIRGKFTIQEFEKHLAWAASQDDVTITTLGHIAATCRADTNIFLANKRIHCVKSLLPGWLWPAEALISVEPAHTGRWIRAWSVVAAYCAVIGLVSFVPIVVAGRLLLPKMRFLRPILRYGPPLALILFCGLYAQGNWFDTRRFFLGLSALVAMNIGVLYLNILCWTRKKAGHSL